MDSMSKNMFGVALLELDMLDDAKGIGKETVERAGRIMTCRT